MNEHLDKYFKGQQTNETFVCFFRHHWITLAREFLYFSIFMLIVIFTVVKLDSIKEILQGDRTMKLFFATGFLIGTIYLHRFFIKLLNYFLDIGIITDMRIIDHQKTLFFHDNMDSIDMSQIQNIEKIQQGLLPTILGYGDIKIFLTASSIAKTFNYVPNAKFHFRCMNRQKEARELNLRQHGGLALGSKESNAEGAGLPKVVIATHHTLTEISKAAPFENK